MEILINEDTAINTASDEIIKTELQLTEHFFKYAQHAYAGKVDPDQQCKLMNKELEHFSAIEKAGGWKEIISGNTRYYKQGLSPYRHEICLPCIKLF